MIVAFSGIIPSGLNLKIKTNAMPIIDIFNELIINAKSGEMVKNLNKS